MKNNGYCLSCQKFYTIKEGERFNIFCPECIEEILGEEEENEAKE